MSRVRERGETARKFILENVETHPRDIVRVLAQHLHISRQAANRHVQNLVNEKVVVAEGNTRSRAYHLAPLSTWDRWFEITPTLGESDAWLEVAPHLGPLPENVRAIWHYGFTEMFNNVLDHSSTDRAKVSVEKNAASTKVTITDFGVGIFKKIQTALNLVDERHSVLELAKGKFTTDPKHHTGEGIFFSSRAFDDFRILSGTVYFSHHYGDDEDWILGDDKGEEPTPPGTMVVMRLDNHTARRLQSVFDEYADVDLGFSKTVVPVVLAQYGDDKLVSRSQAKRLLARFDRFRTVILDFTGVEAIGQGFADEVFRVFATEHPDVSLIPTNTRPEVEAMIRRVRVNASLRPSAS